MAKSKNKPKDKLTQVSERIGSALGKADKQARLRAQKLAAAGQVTKNELEAISKHVEALKKQLAKSTTKLKKALA